MTVREVADELKAAQSSVRLWAKKGKFPGAKRESSPAGDYWLIPESSLKVFKKGSAGRPPGAKNKPKISKNKAE